MSTAEGPAPSTKRIDDAIAFAAEAFRKEKRKGGKIPYVTHLLQVMVRVWEYGGTEDQVIAAVLHDYLEDIEGATPEGLAERFGPEVSRLVVALSDWIGEEEKPGWKERKEQYAERLRHEGADVKLISVADKLHNVRAIHRNFREIGAKVWERFETGRDGQLWYYPKIIEVLGDGWTHPLLDELRAEVRALFATVGIPMPG